jgi:hypothetical protein
MPRKLKHGGKRKGAGRPAVEPSVTVRISETAHRIFEMHAEKQGTELRQSIDVAARLLIRGDRSDKAG